MDTIARDKEFEEDAGPYGYDLTLGSETLQMARGEVPYVYQDEATNHRFMGWLAARDGLTPKIVAMVNFGGKVMIAKEHSIYELENGQLIPRATPEDFRKADAQFKEAK